MAGPYVILNNDYVVDDYAQASYVGTAGDLYVAEGYISGAITGSASLNSVYSVSCSIGIIKQLTAQSDSAVTFTVQGGIIKQISATIDSVLNVQLSANAIVSPSADLQSQFTFTADGDLTKQLSAELITAGDEVTWDTALTWYEPRSEIWGPLFDARGVVNKIASASLSTNFDLSVDGVITAIAEITAEGFASVTANANADFVGTTTLSAEAQVSTSAIKATDVVDFRMNSVATLSGDGFVVVLSQPFTISANFDASTQGNFIADGVVSSDAEFTVNLTGDNFRIRFGESQIASNFAVSVDAVRTLSGVNIFTPEFTVNARASQRHGAFQDVLSAEFTTRTNGGRLRLLSATIDAFAATVGVLTIYNIDPYRVYPIQSEARITKIPQDSRVFMLLDENRVNTIPGETRHYSLTSETRQLIVQPNPLVELETTLDRRQG